MERSLPERIASRIDGSPTAFQCVERIAQILSNHGSKEVSEQNLWDLKPGLYHVKRNDSSLIAFSLSEKKPESIRIVAAHCDSPCFKLKEAPEIEKEGYYISLNTEKYGGINIHTWLDRPLSIAGRVIAADSKGKLRSVTVDLKDDTLIIPSLAIHYAPELNDGARFDLQKDMLPLFACKAEDGSKDSVNDRIRKDYLSDDEEIVGSDLYLYNKEKAILWGTDRELISAPRIDDLACVYTSLEGFLDAEKDENKLRILAVFDNEEIGSRTKQGAGSAFLPDVLRRIKGYYGFSEEELQVVLSKSLLVSADNAQAVHPNHGELSDPVNRPLLNHGIVLKLQAEQKYATDGYSAAVARIIARKKEIPVQVLTNRSDLKGGSTLGCIVDLTTSIPTIDLGMPQLAMHSAYETSGTGDLESMVRFISAFYEYS